MRISRMASLGLLLLAAGCDDGTLSGDGGDGSAEVDAGDDGSGDDGSGDDGSDGGGSDAGPAGDAGEGERAGPGIRPTADNTGVPPGVELRVIDGDVVLDEEGAALDAVDIRGVLVIDASGVRVTRSIIRGRALTSNGAVVRVESGSDILLEDVEIAPAAPTVFIDGVWMEGATLRRANVHGGVDGIKAGSRSIIEYSFIHDLTAFDSDPNQGGGATHNDAIQILSGDFLRVTGNQLLVRSSDNAAIQITQDFGAVSDVLMADNWADGGGCTFNFSHKGGSSLAVETRQNRFGRDSSFDCPILKSTQTSLDSAGDVFDDTDEPVRVQTHD